MEMSRLMIIEKHPNDSTEESADFRHTAPLNSGSLLPERTGGKKEPINRDAYGWQMIVT